MQALHLSEEFAQTERRQARYRGYDIKMERRDLCWMVTMKPSRPALPIPLCSCAGRKKFIGETIGAGLLNLQSNSLESHRGRGM